MIDPETGVSHRETIEGLLKRARTPEKREELESELHSDALPLAGRYLWDIFTRLHNRRSSGGFGVSPITWPDIDAFVRLTRSALSPWEIEVIEDCDAAFLGAIAKRDAKTETRFSGEVPGN
ncbi:phage tail assembly chaperone [Aureimonas ureilytica]|uniref:phage tail assembly chaperone n=1 Tax=Aureimonas ureilytica TaxID=401562 RepID=UPI003D2EF006